MLQIDLIDQTANEKARSFFSFFIQKILSVINFLSQLAILRKAG